VPRPTVRIDGAEPDFYLILFDRATAAQQAVADSLRRLAEAARVDSTARALEAAEMAGTIRWHAVAAHEQGEFIASYREVYWHAINTATPLDTVDTPELRARLGALFGAPTRNAAAAEQEGYAGSEYVQFEYWLVADGEIPILVLDLNGPFGRGLLVAGDEGHLRQLARLKADLARRILDAGPPAPYADYYQSLDHGGWFRTGFDGETYFTNPVRTPRWAQQTHEGLRWRIYR